MSIVNTVSTYDAVRRLLKDEDVKVSTAFFAAVASVGYDLEVMAMDPESLLVEVESSLDSTLSHFVRSKILMGQGAYFTDLMLNDLPSFIDFANVCTADDPPRLDVFNPADVIECSVALLELMIILGHDKVSELKFSDEIKSYWGAILVSEGANWPIKPLLDARMPAGGEADDQAVFDALASRASALSDAVNVAIWTHGKELFEQLKLVPTSDGGQAIMAKDMTSMLTNLVGEFVAPQPTAV